MPGHIKTRDQIVEELKKTCTNVKLQPFSHKWSKTGKPVEMWNIMGEQGYSTAKTKVVVFAHWDTRPSADQEPDPADRVKPILGANDGASGVAVLLELSRAIKDRHPDVGILFLFVDGEDLGPGIDEMFLGAIHFSKHLPVAKPQYGILLDMIGDKDLKVPVEPNSFEMARPLVTAFYGHAMKSGFGTTFPNEWGPTIMDDHLSFNDAGIPTMDLIDFNYDAWHTLRDTPEQCSAESLGKIGKMLESWFVKRPPYKYAAE